MSWRSAHILNIVAAIIIVFTFVLMMVGFWMMLFHDNPPAEFEVPISVDKEAYYPGDSMEVTASVCRYTEADATIYATFINVDTGHIYELAARNVNNLPQGCAMSKVTVLVSENLPPGRYIRRVRADYHVNFMTDRVVELYTEEFDILPLE